MKLDGEKLLADLDESLNKALEAKYGSFSNADLLAIENVTIEIMSMIKSGDYTIKDKG